MYRKESSSEACMYQKKEGKKKRKRKKRGSFELRHFSFIFMTFRSSTFKHDRSLRRMTKGEKRKGFSVTAFFRARRSVSNSI